MNFNPRHVSLSTGALLVMLLVATPLSAATITVDTLADTVAADGDCTLREAIVNANGNDGSQPDCAAGSGDDRIEFGVSGTIIVSGSPLPMLTDQDFTTTIDGGGAVTVSGDDSERIFNVGASVDFRLLNITVADAVSPGLRGGGLVMGTDADVLVRNCTFENNSSELAGGAIANLRGRLVIEDSIFQDNECINCSGGAVHTDFISSEVVIRDSLFQRNSAGGTIAGGAGGALHQFDGGSTTIEDTDFFGNDAGSGGAISNVESFMELDGVTLGDNHGGINGGAITNDNGVLDIASSTLSAGNEAFSGGAIANLNGGFLTVVDTEIADNFSQGSGGAIYDFGGGDITLRRVLVADNETRSESDRDGGGAFIDSGGSLTVINSTFSANEATRSGGAINNFNAGTLTLVKSTIVQNAAADGSGGGISNDDEVVLKDSIIAGNLSGGDCDTANFSSVDAQGLNIDSDGTCTAAANDTTGTGGNVATTDPLLDTLADNGGPTRTHALMSGSPAIDAAPDCGDQDGNPLPTDQRGVSRPQDGDMDGALGCDIGAFEVASASAAPGARIPATSFGALAVLALALGLAGLAGQRRGRA